jgi:hypothetical protein
LATGAAVRQGQRRARGERRRTFDGGTIAEFGAVDLRFLISLAPGHQH